MFTVFVKTESGDGLERRRSARGADPTLLNNKNQIGWGTDRSSI